MDKPLLRLFVAFEGGGAKGLVHIGALKALEAKRFQFCGLAGTSAGAIVAALKAAGYSADELVCPSTRKTILNELEEVSGRKWRTFDLFGRGAWRRIRTLKLIYNFISNEVFINAVKSILGIFIFTILILVCANNWSYIFDILLVLGIISIVSWVLFVGFAGRLLKGLADPRTFRDQISILLSRKMYPAEPERKVKMGDFGRDGRPSLKIVAADISSKKLRLFSSDEETDKDIDVADVVCASICLPIIFEPWSVDGRLYLDGGLVSNLPVWPFDEERALDHDALTVAVEIADTEPESTPTKANWIMHGVRTAIFGASILNKRAVDRLVLVNLNTDLDLLDFDAPLERVIKTISDAEKATNNQISEQIFEIPDIYLSGCNAVKDFVNSSFDQLDGILCDGGRKGRVRCSLAMNVGNSKKVLRITHCSGYENDTDEGLLLPIDHSLVGESWRTRKVILKTAPFPDENNLQRPEFKKIRRYFAGDIEWILTVPIWRCPEDEGGDPMFVVAVDGSAKLHEDEELIGELAVFLSGETRKLFQNVVQNLESRKLS